MRLLICFLILLGLIVAVAATAKWAFWPSRNLPVNRVRQIRIRLHLRLHPGRGFASAFECWLRWGRLASFHGSRRARPSLSFWQRLTHPGEHSVFVGRAHYRLRLRVPVQESITITAPQLGFRPVPTSVRRVSRRSGITWHLPSGCVMATVFEIM